MFGGNARRIPTNNSQQQPQLSNVRCRQGYSIITRL